MQTTIFYSDYINVYTHSISHVVGEIFVKYFTSVISNTFYISSDAHQNNGLKSFDMLFRHDDHILQINILK